MGQQTKTIVKRRRRKLYLKRKNEQAKTGVIVKKTSVAKKSVDEAKKPAAKKAAKKAPAKKAPAKKAAKAVEEETPAAEAAPEAGEE
jgi:hypothetical protein